MKKLKSTLLLAAFCCLYTLTMFGQIENPCDYLPDTLTSIQLVPKEVSVVVKDAYVDLIHVRAELELIYDTVLVKEAYHGYRQPVYQSVEEYYLKTEAYNFFRIDSAIFEAEPKKIQISPAYTAFVKTIASVGARQLHAPRGLCAWKKTKIPENATTYEYLQLVKPAIPTALDISAEYITLIKQVVSDEFGPESDTAITIEAEYEVITRQALVKPAYIEEVIVPEKRGTYIIYEKN